MLVIIKLTQILTYVIFKPIFILLGVKFIPKKLSGDTVIITSNHVSMADFMLVPGVISIRDTLKTPPFFAMTANKYLKWPLFGQWLKLNGGFPVKNIGKNNHGLKQAIVKLKSSHNIILFPEGGLPVKGKKRTPKTGIEVMVKETGANILPIYIHKVERRFFPKFAVITGAQFQAKDMKVAEIMDKVEQLKNKVPSNRL